MRYFIVEIPTDSAAMRLSRTAMIARPVRLRTRLRMMTSATMMSTKPAKNVEILSVPDAPWAPLMMAMPPSMRPRSATVLLPLALKMTCSPFASKPTMRQLMISLMISPNARVTMAR